MNIKIFENILIYFLNKIMKINCIHHVNQQPQTKSLQKTSTISLGKTNYHKLSEPTDVNYSQHLKNFTNIKPI